jgi:hypothetical protein
VAQVDELLPKDDFREKTSRIHAKVDKTNPWTGGKGYPAPAFDAQNTSLVGAQNSQKTCHSDNHQAVRGEVKKGR